MIVVVIVAGSRTAVFLTLGCAYQPTNQPNAYKFMEPL